MGTGTAKWHGNTREIVRAPRVLFEDSGEHGGGTERCLAYTTVNSHSRGWLLLTVAGTATS